jgi:hypothetical protein
MRTRPSTEVGDNAEINGIRAVFGDRGQTLAVSSTKSATGHMLGAAGAMEAVISILALRHQTLPPTLNLHDPEDVARQFDLVPLKGQAQGAQARAQQLFRLWRSQRVAGLLGGLIRPRSTLIGGALPVKVHRVRKLIRTGDSILKRLLGALLGAMILAVPASGAGIVEYELSAPSPTLGHPIPYAVYRPFPFPAEGERWPVVYLLHGLTGKDGDWFTWGNLGPILDQAIADGRVPPLVIVAPGFGDSWYVDNPMPAASASSRRHWLRTSCPPSMRRSRPRGAGRVAPSAGSRWGAMVPCCRGSTIQTFTSAADQLFRGAAHAARAERSAPLDPGHLPQRLRRSVRPRAVQRGQTHSRKSTG